MTQQATAPAVAPQTTSAEPGSGITVVPSLEDRSAAAFGELETAGDAATPAPPGDGASSAASSPPDVQAAKDRAERRAALAAATAKERDRVDAQSAMREAAQLRAELERIKAQPAAPAAAAEPDSPEAFFAIAQKLASSGKLTAQQLGEWIREQTANPELAAARAATSIVDPKLSALEKKIAEQASVIDRFMQQQQQAHEQREEQASAHQFFQFTEQNAATAPKSAAFLSNFGPNEFYKLALKASESVPQSAGPQAVLDEIEENLQRFGAIYAPQPAATNQRPPAPAAHQIHAPAKAPTTISNTLAQQRATVVDEDADWANLPFEERSARLFR